MAILITMNKWKIHTGIIVLIIIYGIFVYSGIDEEEQFGVLKIFPVLIIGGLYLGILFVLYILPNIIDKGINSVLGSNEEIEADPYHDAHLAVAQGDYPAAIQIFKDRLETDTENMKPWVEIAKIQLKNLENPPAAIKTYQKALTKGDWSDNDTAYFMSRIADIQRTELEDQAAATETLQSIVAEFPDTRHSANAKHHLREIDADKSEASES